MNRANIYSRTRGFTMVEMIIAIALFAIVFALFASIVGGSMRYMRNMEMEQVSDSRCSSALYQIRDQLLKAKKIYERGSNWDVLANNLADLTDCTPVTNSRMPDLGGPDDSETFGIDGTTEGSVTYTSKTGNFLFFVQKATTACCDIDNDGDVDYSVDLYRFMAYYPREISTGSCFTTHYRLELLEWQSILYADHSTIVSIETTPSPVTGDAATDRNRVLTLLYNEKQVTHLCAVGSTNPATNTFYVVNGTGDPLEATGYTAEASGYKIGKFKTTSIIRLPSHFSLGMNGMNISPAANKYTAVNGRYPGGFEVQITGMYNILLRLVIIGRQTEGFVKATAAELIVKTSGY